MITIEFSKQFFIAYCKTVGIDFRDGTKVIDGRYKPYLSILDNKYYKGNNLWDAKVNALIAAIEKKGDSIVRAELAVMKNS